MFVSCHSKFVCHPSFLGNDCISFHGNHGTIPFKVTIPSFQTHFVQQKHNVQMAAVMIQVVFILYTLQSVYTFVQIHTESILSAKTIVLLNMKIPCVLFPIVNITFCSLQRRIRMT